MSSRQNHNPIPVLVLAILVAALTLFPVLSFGQDFGGIPGPPVEDMQATVTAWWQFVLNLPGAAVGLGIGWFVWGRGTRTSRGNDADEG